MYKRQILGFSFQGTTIPAGTGAIATVYHEPMEGMDFVSELCFSDAVVSDPVASPYFTFASCSEFINPFQMPISLTAEGGPGAITLNWVDEDTRSRATVDLQITNYGNGQAEIYMINTEPVGGFQFDIDAGNGLSGLSVTNASGGSAQGAGFTVSTNTTGLVLGFSFTGATIPAGDGVLCYVDATFTGENGELSISSATMSDALGNSLDVDLGTAYYVGVQEIYGCTDPLADNYNPDATADDGNCEYEGCTDPLADNYDPDANVNYGSCVYPPAAYTIFRDGSVLATGVDMMMYVDSGLGASETYCYTCLLYTSPSPRD